MDGIRAKIDFLLKHNMIANKLFKFIGNGFFRTIGLFCPISDRMILFSGHSRNYNDSPKAIYEKMLTDPRFNDFIFIWALENPTESFIPGKCLKVKADSWKYFLYALRSKYWITCVNIERGLKFKKNSQIYLNTWHGIPIKNIGNDAVGRKDYDFSHIDFFCVSSDFEIDVYKKAFNIKESQVLRSGLPRNESLYNIDQKEIIKLKKSMKIPLDKKIILYAPTWRDSENGGFSYDIKPPIDIKYWEKMLKDKYVVLLRTHPYTTNLIGIEFNDFVYDFINYPDVNDLMKVSDVLISDYSAIILDYSILERPIISFAYDYEDYKVKRGLTIDLEKYMKNNILKNEKEVIDKLLNMDYEFEQKNTKNFKKSFITYGSNSIEECINAILKKDK